MHAHQAVHAIMKLCNFLSLLVLISINSATGGKLQNCYNVNTDIVICIAGVVELSPSPGAPICQAGADQLELTCNTTSGEALVHRWEFTVFPENVTHAAGRPVESIGVSGVPPNLRVNTSTITFSRLSGPNVLSLISRATINPVSSIFNGTVVKCIDNMNSVATTTIQVVHSQQFGETPQ